VFLGVQKCLFAFPLSRLPYLQLVVVSGSQNMVKGPATRDEPPFLCLSNKIFFMSTWRLNYGGDLITVILLSSVAAIRDAS